MNDSKNLILAVVLSALVLLGWTWAANKYFPAANPPSTKVESGKQQPVPQPQVQSTPTAPKVLQSISAALASNPRLAAWWSRTDNRAQHRTRVQVFCMADPF